MKYLLILLLASCGYPMENPSTWMQPTFHVSRFVEDDFDICTVDGGPLTLIERDGDNRRIWTSGTGCISEGTALYRVTLEPGLEYALVSECQAWVVSGFDPL